MSSLRLFLAHWFVRPAALNSLLIRLIVGAVGPLLIFSTVMMVLFARQEQANRKRGLEDTARALTLAVDQELESSITSLEALATAEPLDFGAVDIFRPVAARFLRTQGSWKRITLFDPQGRPVMGINKSLTPEESKIGQSDLDDLLRTRRPVISDFPTVKSAEKEIAIQIPVIRERELIYVLSAAIDPGIFNQILAKQKLPETWLGSLFDRKKIIVARTREPERFTGRLVGSLLDKADLQANDQFISGVTRVGTPADAAISRSQLSGWFVALTVPSSELNAILYRSLAMLGGGGLLLLLSGLFVALIFARQVSRSIGDLSRAAHDLGRGQSITFPGASSIAELDGLAREMERAAELLQERDAQRNRVESALRKQEESLQRQADLLDLANEAILAFEPGGKIVYWNSGAVQLYGYSAEEAIGRVSHDLLATDLPQGWPKFESELIARREWSGEIKQVTKHGRRIDVESRFKLIDDRTGGSLVLECNRDISHRKRNARRLTTEHSVTLVLAESETLEAAWKKMLNMLGEGLDCQMGVLWIVNKKELMIECHETWASPAGDFAGCEKRFPLRRGEGLPGRVWAAEKSIWLADIKQEASALRRSLPAHEGLRSAFAFPIKMRSEVLGVIEFFSTEIREPDEDLLSMTQAIAGEIGQFVERMRAEAALRQSEEHLRNQAQALEQQLLASGRLVAVGELTASMAHEFNNPLGIILGFAQGLLASMDPADTNYHHVQIIAEEARRCEKLVQELLEFGRPKNADFAPTDVERIIQKTVDLVQNHAGKNHVDVTTRVADALPRIYADAQQLQQVLLNLSLNAVDAMPRGGKLVVAAAADDPDRLTLSVSDTGIGIEADVLPRIFQPFFTSKKRRGLGLGLPICDRIVRSHGGKIDVDSEPGHGTTFIIHLPLSPPELVAST
ncbi:MAG TPA: ATP-binding protein [Terriglobales bacterium]|nr:ATP-binding protein [Terriglobales bacterium]